MSKTFTYTAVRGYRYKSEIDFDYEVENIDLLPEIVDLIFDEYFEEIKQENKEVIKKALKKMIDEHDLVETIADNYEDTLKELFEEKAFNCFED